MLNDWVICETPTSEFLYRKVICISEYYVTIGTLNDNVCVEIDKVGWIPVTPEILFKNGFDKYSDGYYANYSSDMHISPTVNCNSWYIFNSHNEYIHNNAIAKFSAVHELQNILRVIEFNDLADNFKI